MKTRIKVGLIGRGRWGGKIKTTIAEHCPGLEVLWQTGISPSFLTCYAKQPVDGVIIATPAATHADILRWAFVERVPVFVEKPLVTSEKELQGLDPPPDLPVVVDHTYLFHPTFAVLRGRVSAFEGTVRVSSVGGNDGPVRADVSPLWDYGPHDVALALGLFADDPIDIKADASVFRDGKRNYWVKLKFKRGSATLWFGNGFDVRKREFSVLLSNGKRSVWWPHGGESAGASPLGNALLTFETAIRLVVGEEGKWLSGFTFGARVVKTLSTIERHIGEIDS